MHSRENTIAAVQGGKIDYIPSGFWLHFPRSCFYGQAAVEAHLDFFRDTGTDIMKVMNENVVPCTIPIKKPEDWAKISAFDRNSSFIQDQLEITKQILDKVHDQGIVLLTVHGVVASAWHARGGTAGYETGCRLLTEHLRANPKAVAQAYDRISDALAILTEEAFKIGVDGIYYAALGGESYLYTNEEFEEFVKPNDLKVLETAKKRPAFNILHICKDHLDLSRYKDYPIDVINWGVYENNPSLLDGRKVFPTAAILGGLDDRSGVLVNGTEEEINNEVCRIISEMNGERFLLGADCTLPTEIDLGRVRTAVCAARNAFK